MVSERISLFTSRTGLNNTRCPRELMGVVLTSSDWGNGAGMSAGEAVAITENKAVSISRQSEQGRFSKVLLISQESVYGICHRADIALKVAMMATGNRFNSQLIHFVTTVFKVTPVFDQQPIFRL